LPPCGSASYIRNWRSLVGSERHSHEVRQGLSVKVLREAEPVAADLKGAIDFCSASLYVFRCSSPRRRAHLRPEAILPPFELSKATGRT